MTANLPRDILDTIEKLKADVRSLQASRSNGAQPALWSSTSHPGNPALGQPIYETDTGLTAYWNGSAWTYPPQLIYKTVLSASASSVRIPGAGNIPQVFTNLRLVISARSDGTGTSGYDAMNMQLNGVTSGYNWQTLWTPQNATTVSATGTAAQTSMQAGEVWNAHFGTAGRGIVTMEIPSYSDTSNVKSFTSLVSATDGSTAGILQRYSGALSAQTAAITSISLLMSAGNFVSGSTFSLYGM